MGIPSPPSCPYSPSHQQPTSLSSPCGPDTPPPAYSPTMDHEPKYATQLHMPGGGGSDNIAMDTSSAFNVMNSPAVPPQAQAQVGPPQANQIVMNDPPYWCNIAYYELNSRVGEIFHAKSACPEIYVDGFTHPGMTSSPNHAVNRFCLGQLSNVNRNSTIENTRRHIGQGNNSINILICLLI